MHLRHDTDAAAVHRALSSARAGLAEADDDLLRAQVAVTQIAAPTGEEGERAAWIERRFRGHGLTDVHIDGAGNVIGRRPGAREGPAVVICAHLDTVFPRGTDLTVRRDGGRLSGPGINDNGRGLAVMLALAAIVDGHQLHTHHPIEFVATTGEEGIGDLRGAKHYFAERGALSMAAIALDGAGDDRVIHRALGSRRFRISFSGPGGHSWAAYGAPNANHAAAVAAAHIARITLPDSPRTTVCIGRMGGGISVNSIADSAWLEIDLRSTSATVMERVSIEIARLVRSATDDENWRRGSGTAPMTGHIEQIGDRPGGETAVDHPLVRAAIEATTLVRRVPELTLASTDANVPISRGIPAIAIGGGGSGGDAHTREEWFDNTEGTRGVARALTILGTAAGLYC